MPIDHSLAPVILAHQATRPWPKPDSAGPGALVPSARSESQVAVAAYAVSSQPEIDRLRQAAGQLAGLLVLAASGARSITPEHAVLAAARTAHKEAYENLRRTRAPAAASIQHHHVLLAAELIGIALSRGESAIALRALECSRADDALGPLRDGYAHLQRAAALLPGIDLLGFFQGCCGSHPAVAGRTLDHS